MCNSDLCLVLIASILSYTPLLEWWRFVMDRVVLRTALPFWPRVSFLVSSESFFVNLQEFESG